MRDRIFNPQEYLEHVNNLSEEEREQRRYYFTHLFAEHGFEGQVA